MQFLLPLDFWQINSHCSRSVVRPSSCQGELLILFEALHGPKPTSKIFYKILLKFLVDQLRHSILLQLTNIFLLETVCQALSATVLSYLLSNKVSVQHMLNAKQMQPTVAKFPHTYADTTALLFNFQNFLKFP